VFGGKIVRAQNLMHGKTSPIHHNQSGIFKDIPTPFDATRYHSLIIEQDSLPEEIKITAWTDQREIMGIQHTSLPVYGVQFHPESILTQHGKILLANFLALT
jgi:anthranilate synthase/aminodeoxychorismate synthase-like glutamine amidotransferase